LKKPPLRPRLFRGDLAGVAPDQDYQSAVSEILSRPTVSRVDAISYVADLKTLKKLGVVAGRARPTRVLLVPPIGMPRKDVERLCKLAKSSECPELEVRQLRPGVEDLVAHLKLILVEDAGRRIAVIGSSNFTTAGTTRNVELNTFLAEPDRGFGEIGQLFDRLWSDELSEPARSESFVREPQESWHRPIRSLLPFQQEAYDGLSKEYDKHPKGGALLSLPTGAGKTVVAAKFILEHILDRPNVRVAWLAPRDELLAQAADTFDWMRPFWQFSELAVQRPKDRERSGLDRYNVVFSTIHGAAKEPVTARPSVVVIDEAHWAASQTASLLQDALNNHPGAFRLGLTATPVKSKVVDTAHLNKLFRHGPHLGLPREKLEKVVDALKRRVLASVKPQREKTEVQIRLDHSQFSAVELNRNALKLFDSDKRCRAVARRWKKSYGPTLVFALDVPHANRLAKEFVKLESKPSVQVVHTGEMRGVLQIQVQPRGDTLSRDERKRIHRLVQKGEIDIVISVELYTTGVDFPKVRTLFMARPTLSPVLYAQMLGRGLRGEAFGGTKEVRVVDFADQLDTHELLKRRMMNVANLRTWDQDVTKRNKQWEAITKRPSRPRKLSLVLDDDFREAYYQVLMPNSSEEKQGWTDTTNLTNSLTTAVRKGRLRGNHRVNYFALKPRHDFEVMKALWRGRAEALPKDLRDG
jgi:superfamily II DNA or RNA helicase